MKKYLLGIFIFGAALSLFSCDDDDENVFSDTAAVRIDKAVSESKELLVSSPNGWLLHYFTGAQYTGGGFTMLIKFDGSKAHVSSDISEDVNLVTTSSYDVIKDQGPVLTLNTYNEIFHFLSQPYMGDVDGEEGDYEFIIQRKTQDSIYLKGKKWGNKMVMTRVPENVVWADYLTELKKVDEAVRPMCVVKNGENVVDTIIIDRDAHNVMLTSQTSTVPYYYVPGGIVLHKELKAKDGSAFSSLALSDAANSKFATNSGAVSIEKCSDPKYNMDAIDFAAKWIMTYTDIENRTVNDTLVLEKTDSYVGKVSHTTLQGTLKYKGKARVEAGSRDLEDARGDYTIFFFYDHRSGKVGFYDGSTSLDPTEKYGYLIFRGAMIDSEGYFGFGTPEFDFTPDNLNVLTPCNQYNGFCYLNTYTDEDGDTGLALRTFGLNIKKLTRIN